MSPNHEVGLYGRGDVKKNIKKNIKKIPDSQALGNIFFSCNLTIIMSFKKYYAFRSWRHSTLKLVKPRKFESTDT